MTADKWKREFKCELIFVLLAQNIRCNTNIYFFKNQPLCLDITSESENVKFYNSMNLHVV